MALLFRQRNTTRTHQEMS